MQKHKVIFLGTSEFALPSLQALIDNVRIEVAAVITEPDRPAGRNRQLTPPPVKILAEKNHIPVLQPEELSVVSCQLSVLKPEVAVVVAYGQIIPQEVLDILKFGFVNIHPSLLPKYRGPAPIQAAILNGDKETGVTLMKMDRLMDHGEVISNVKCQISNLNYKELSDKLANLGAELLPNTLLQYLEGRAKFEPQDHDKATYTKLIKKSDGLINWREPVKIIERKIRAYNPWPGTYTFINHKYTNNTNNTNNNGKKRLKILKAHLQDDKLVFEKVQMEGKNPLSWQNFKQGYRLPLDFGKDVVI